MFIKNIQSKTMNSERKPSTSLKLKKKLKDNKKTAKPGLIKKRVKKIFKIVKIRKEEDYVREILDESECDWEMGVDEKANFELEKEKLIASNADIFIHSAASIEKTAKTKTLRVHPFSRVNFAKLSIEEKEKRLKNLAKVVKKMKRQLKNIDLKIKKNAPKLLNKFISEHIKSNSNKESSTNYLTGNGTCSNNSSSSSLKFGNLPNSNSLIQNCSAKKKHENILDFEKLCKSLSFLNNFDGYEFDDEKNILKNLITLIADGVLSPGSLKFKHICSILRTLLPSEECKPINEANVSYFNFSDVQTMVSKKEHEFFIKMNPNNFNLKYFYELNEGEVFKPTLTPPLNQSENWIRTDSGISPNNINSETIPCLNGGITNNHLTFSNFLPQQPLLNFSSIRTNHHLNTDCTPTNSNSNNFNTPRNVNPSFQQQSNFESTLFSILLLDKYKQVLNGSCYNKFE
jgi:hypothetical protein